MVEEQAHRCFLTTTALQPLSTSLFLSRFAWELNCGYILTSSSHKQPCSLNADIVIGAKLRAGVRQPRSKLPTTEATS
eukprot:6098451-Amphidinium_carterae.1